MYVNIQRHFLRPKYKIERNAHRHITFYITWQRKVELNIGNSLKMSQSAFPQDFHFNIPFNTFP